MKLTSKINMIRYIGRTFLGLAWLLLTPSIASADPCASKYPAERHLAPAFHDVFQNSCYSCPQGYNRTGEGIFSERACAKPAGTVFSRATDHGRGTGLLGTDCRASGSFLDIGLGRCYSCPPGYGRTAYSVTSGQACARNEPLKFSKATARGPGDSPEAKIENLAKQEIQKFANSFVYSLQQIVSLSEDPGFLEKIASKDRRYNAEIEARLEDIINNNSALRSFKTISIGGTADANVIGINGAIDTGLSVSIAGVRPVYWYGGASYGVKVGVGASAGLSLGIWMDENNAISGDYHGFSVDLYSVLSGNAINTLRNIRSASSSAGVGFEIAAWFNERHNDRFLGFTITPSFGKGISITPGGYSRGHTTQVTQ